MRKSKTEEIQHIGRMLTATMIEDVKRIETAQKRLSELSR